MKRLFILMIGLLFMMFVGVQQSYAHDHHDIKDLQNQDNDITIVAADSMESGILNSHEPSPPSKAVSTPKKNSITLAVLAIVNARNYCSYCSCGIFSHSTNCGGGHSCYLHEYLWCDNNPIL